ncbi:peptide chain release factor eRF/aRF, subunit 1, partial [mine drainage metagenome]
MIEHAAHEFFVRIAEIAAELFLPMKDQLKGILLGGPGATKEYFYNEHYLHHELQQKVVEPLFDTGYTDEYGLKEMVEKATQTLHGLELTEEKRLIQRLLVEVRRAEQGLAAYGESEVERALALGAVDLLIVSEGLKKRRWRFRCSGCNAESGRIGSSEEAEQYTGRPCGQCGQRAVKLRRERRLRR